jgi:hypothetical protein
VTGKAGPGTGRYQLLPEFTLIPLPVLCRDPVGFHFPLVPITLITSPFFVPFLCAVWCDLAVLAKTLKKYELLTLKKKLLQAQSCV